jgi:hypothetical protein
MKQNGSDNPQITPLGGPAIGGRREQRVPRRIATLDVTPSGGRTLYTLNAADGSDAQAVHLAASSSSPAGSRGAVATGMTTSLHHWRPAPGRLAPARERLALCARGACAHDQAPPSYRDRRCTPPLWALPMSL